MDGMTEWNKACLPCRLVHATCNGERPCKRCSALGRPDNCVNVERKKRGRPRKNPIEGEELLEKRARLNEGNEHSGAASLGMADSSASHNMATTYHMSFPSVSVQQPAPRGSFYPPSSSPSDSPHSSPSSSSSSSSGEHQQSEAMLARPQRHHHHQHHQYHHSGSSSSRHHHHHHKRSRDRHEEEHSTDVGLLINEMRELRKENKMLNEKLATFCEKVDRRLTSSECKIDSLSQSLTTTTSTGSFNMAGSTPSGWSSTATFSASPLFIRKEVLKDLPFLLDYDIISEQVPFLIDDLRKPFIVRRIFDPTPEEDRTVPVTTYANPACCALLGTVLHELVGAPCWFALEQPIRAYLTARSDKPVGDIFLNAVTRKGNRKRLLRLFSRNQVFYNAKGNAKWWISIIDKTEELTASGQQDSNKIALILNRNRRGGATISLLPKDGESDDEDATPSTTQTSPSSSGSSPAVSTPSTSSSSSSYASSSSAPLTSVVTTISSLPASSALSTSRSLAPASSFSTAANFFVPATTYASPFISTSSLAPVSSPSISSFLYSAGLPGAISAPALRSEGAVGELSDFASSIAGGGMNPRVSQGGDKPEYLDPELQELWALLAPTDFSGQPSAALSTCK